VQVNQCAQLVTTTATTFSNYTNKNISAILDGIHLFCPPNFELELSVSITVAKTFTQLLT
jgi:hypothetical protein